MSLTSFLEENADVREYLRTAFRKPNFPDAPPLVVPPVTKNPPLVGTAFDYLARWMVLKINPEAIERERWVAEAAIARLPDKKLQKRGIEIVRKARATSKQFLKNGNLSDDVIVAAISLVPLDVVFRTRRFAELVGAAAQPEDIADLRSLVTAFPLEQFKARTRSFLNPAFGNASRAIGGADADLIIDDLLLDIKVRKDASIRGEDFQALIGYYLLYELGGVDGVYYLPRVSRVGFYSARYRLFASWPVTELLTGAVSLHDALQWLRGRLGMTESIPEKPTRRKARPKTTKA